MAIHKRILDKPLTDKQKEIYPQAEATENESTYHFVEIAAMGTPISLNDAKALANEISGQTAPGDEMPSDALVYQQTKRLQTLIEERKKRAALFANVTPEMVIGATAMRAFASIDDAFDDEGNFDIKKARESGAIHLIKKLEKTRAGWKVEFYDAAAAQDKLGNYLGLEKAPQSNSDSESLRQGVEAVAKSLAGGGPVTQDIMEQAWAAVTKWAVESKAKYTQEAMDSVAKDLGLAKKVN